MNPLKLPAIPFELTPTRVEWRVDGGEKISARSEPHTDIFISPVPQHQGKLDAATLLGEAPPGDFQFSARISVKFASTYDAGVLLIWFDEKHWAKLCFEAAPNLVPTVVSVVNRTVSDDANAFTVSGETVWLRISRTDGIFMFHASLDGNHWEMVRIFALDGDTPQIGFEVQSPTGEGCEVTFDDIRFASTTLTDPRNGS